MGDLALGRGRRRWCAPLPGDVAAAGAGWLVAEVLGADFSEVVGAWELVQSCSGRPVGSRTLFAKSLTVNPSGVHRLGVVHDRLEAQDMFALGAALEGDLRRSLS